MLYSDNDQTDNNLLKTDIQVVIKVRRQLLLSSSSNHLQWYWDEAKQPSDVTKPGIELG